MIDRKRRLYEPTDKLARDKKKKKTKKKRNENATRNARKIQLDVILTNAWPDLSADGPNAVSRTQPNETQLG